MPLPQSRLEVVDGDAELHVMNADGTEGVNVGNDPGWDQAAAWGTSPWSPDGTRLAFMSNRNGAHDIFVVNPDGTGLTNVSAHAGVDDFLSWSPDGTQILFRSNRSGNWEIYVMDADGPGVTQLTDDPADDGRAIWVKR